MDQLLSAPILKASTERVMTAIFRKIVLMNNHSIGEVVVTDSGICPLLAQLLTKSTKLIQINQLIDIIKYLLDYTQLVPL